ncbi:MAG: hypothetical protein BroJett039_09450 [Chloroflexota bacterium]|nr:MAG: hypothetical protein BroJett039_09450 [Chloroflexota bacterium]
MVIGLEHVLPKVANWYAALEAQNIRVVIYSMDQFGLTRGMRDKLGVRVFLTPEFFGIISRWLIGIPFLLLLWVWFRPRHVEVYDPEIAGRFWTACIKIISFLRIKLVILNRGGAFGYDEQSDPKKLWLSKLYNDATCIIYKELYMKSLFLQKYGLRDPNKLALVHNRVRIEPEPLVERSGNPVVLYLNSFGRWKRPDLCIQAAAVVCQHFPNVEFWFVGDIPNNKLATENYKNSVWRHFGAAELQTQAEQLRVGEQIKFFDFTDNPTPFYDRAWVFLFPSDLVFCNFSLLEAMERGIPPIISDAQDGERIVDDGITGFRVPQTGEAIARRVLALLEDEALRRKMGLAARAKIIKEYNIADTAKILADVYRTRVWRAPLQDHSGLREKV